VKVTIEIWQSSFNEEWNCDISTNDDGIDATEYWAVDDFAALLQLVSEKFPKAKCITKEIL